MVQMENDKVSPATRAEHRQHFQDIYTFSDNLYKRDASWRTEEFHPDHKDLHQTSYWKLL